MVEVTGQEDSPATRNILFGKYEMGRLLGQGTFAKVYYGRNLSTSESVAIKVIHKDQIRRESGLVHQIQREISVMGLVRHPNVVHLHEVLATRTKIFMIMEYVRGGELFASVARGKLPEAQARKYFQQLVSAVDFCHSRGVYHRDLKPENLLVDDGGDLKISDFGLSALPEQLRHDGLLHTQCGTPAYVAPEVLRRKGYDGAKADAWSCGVVLFVLLSGFLPFQDENLMKMYRKIFKAEYQVPPWVSPEARRLIGKLLVADPERRISIQAVMDVPWFKKGFARPVGFSITDTTTTPDLQNKNKLAVDDEEEEEVEEVKNTEENSNTSSPRFYNAFELISAMSSGFDLSSLFESGGRRRRRGTVFTSRRPVAAIVEALGRMGRGLGFRVKEGRRKSRCEMRMEGSNEGRKGRLAVTAEVFEVAEEVAVVEFSKSSGDTLEYVKFCEEDVRPGLKDIVWAWQGDHDHSDDTDHDDSLYQS